MAPAAQLLVALQRLSAGRRRVALDDVWRAFRQAVPGYIADSEARIRLAALLADLEDGGQLSRPRGRKLWDHTIDPPLPSWIELNAAPRPSPPPRDHQQIAWPPPLAFVSTLRRVRNLDELLAIRTFLASGPDRYPTVPIRERSVEIFGDEKRLDVLSRSSLFAPGRLTLELLRCHEVAPPLVWEPGPASSPPCILVLENLHTYDSFRRWNRTAAAYRAIAYGHGSEFFATVRDLPRLLADLDATEALYFGDLDPNGLHIAAAADRWLRDQGLDLVPATRWYSLLLDRAEGRRIPGEPTTAASLDLAWLPPPLRERTRALFTAGHRGPQELVGLELLGSVVALLDAP